MKDISVLIVDDEKMDRYILKRSLNRVNEEIEIFEAEDGREAINFFSDKALKKVELGGKYPPYFIFLDINMPLISGLEFLDKFQELREEDRDLQELKIFMLSSSSNPKDYERAMAYDFVDRFIVKGDASPDKMKEILTEVLASA